MLDVLLLGLGAVAVADTLRRLGVSTMLASLLTLAGCLVAAWAWAGSPWPLLGLAGAGLATLIPAVLTPFSGPRTATSVPRTPRSRIPPLP